MEENFVVTIGREFGSYGGKIGQKLSELLNIPFYDKNIIKEVAKRSGYDEKILKETDERHTNSLLFSIATNIFPRTNNLEDIEKTSFEDKLYVLQKNLIKEFASKGSCVVMGRCANHVLKQRYKCFNIFIYSNMEKRIEYVQNEYHTNEKEAIDIINKMDKKRSSYYNYYTGGKWGSNTDYNLLLNSSVLGIDETAEFLKHYIEIMLNRKDI